MRAATLAVGALLLASPSFAEGLQGGATSYAVSPSTPAPVAAPPLAPKPKPAPKKGDKDNIPSPGQLDNLFDGGTPPKSPDPEARRGLRFFGLDLGSGIDPQNDSHDPYNRKGIDQVLDWDVRARIELDGLGATFRYRHPGETRRFTLSYKQYVDVPGLLQIGAARDKIYGAVGQPHPPDPSGFDVSASGNVDPRWGFTAEVDRKKLLQPVGTTSDTNVMTGVGFSPFGNNPGKDWNVTYVLFLNHENIGVDVPGVKDDRSGFGYATGLAYQHALKNLPIPILNSPATQDYLWLDRFKATFMIGGSEVWSFSINASAGASLYITKYLDIFGGANLKIIPHPSYYTEQKVSVGPNIGLGVHGF